MSLQDRLRKFDAQTTVSKEFQVHTASGAVLSVVTVCIILYLLVTEMYFNFQVRLQERVYVNETSSNGIEFEFDLTLYSVPCSLVNIDANDVTGQSQSLHLDTQHHVWKHRVKHDDKGNRHFIGDRTKLELGSTLLEEKDLIVDLERKIKESESESQDELTKCGSCFGAEEEGECCNTCDDVRRAYKRKGWVLPELSTIKQCRKEGMAMEEEGEGCNVHGVVALSSGGGNLHLAPGKDMEASGATMMDLIMQAFQQYNVSHTLHKIRLGPEYPEATYQLDGESRMITDGHGMYQYYISVVPTLYRFLNGTSIQTNQYSVTEHLRHVEPGSDRGLPGIFFFYEVSPLHVEIAEVYRRGWVAFFTSVCAVIGGVVSMAGILDQYLFSRQAGQRGSLGR